MDLVIAPIHAFCFHFEVFFSKHLKRKEGSVKSVSWGILTGAAGEGRAHVQPSVPALPRALTALLVQSSPILPRFQQSLCREAQNCCVTTLCNVHPCFKHYKVLTGSRSEYNTLPSSGFPCCSSRFLHGNNCKWRASLSPCAPDSNCITLTRAQVTE